jgi:hypothetical protein
VHPFVFVGSGLILWIHPIGICAIAGVGIAAALGSDRWAADGWQAFIDVALARGVTGWRRAVLLSLHLGVVAMAVAFLAAFAGGRLELGLLRVDHPQKIFRELTMLVLGVVGGHAVLGATTSRRRGAAAAGWFLLGVFPVVLYALRGSAPGAAIATRTFGDLPRLSVVIFRDALPIVLGMRGLSSELIQPWWLHSGFTLTLALFGWYALTRIWRQSDARSDRSLTVPLVTAAALAIMLLPGGTFLDVTSYRYLMPFIGLAMISAAGAIGWLDGRSRTAAVTVAAFTLTGFLAGDWYWYNLSQPNNSDRQIIDCLERQGVHAAKAEYWLAYRLTFRSLERVITVPDTGPDRYAPYDRVVSAAALVAHVDEWPAPAPDGFRDICSSSNLHASLPAQRVDAR